MVERGDEMKTLPDEAEMMPGARPRSCAAFAAAERLRVTVDADGAEIARGGFPKWPFLELTKMKGA